MKYLSVCSGIEAATVAWHSLGWEPQAFSEIEKFPSQVLKHHYPNVPNLGDMTKFEEWNLGTIDLLVGGTPCQSFSVAGLRKGLDDPRGNLMLTYGAIANRFRPRWLVWENVPGVLSSNGGRDFGSFLGMLGELGYGWAYRVLDAQYFGVAQRRRRVFVVGYLGNWRRAAAVLFERHSLQGNPAPSRKKGQEVAGTFTARAKSGGWGQDPNLAAGGYMRPVAVESVSPTLTRRGTGVSGVGHNEDGWYVTTARMVAFGEYVDDGIDSAMKARDYKDATDLVAHTLRGEGFDASEDGTGRETPLVPVGIFQDSEFGVQQYDSAGTLRAGRIPEHQMVMQPIALAENTIGRQPQNGGNGDGFTEGGPMYTLNATGVHGVAQPISFGAQMSVPQVDFDLNQTLQAKNPMAVALPINIYGGNKRSDRPEGGFYIRLDENTSKTLDAASGLNPTCSQGGTAVMQPIAFNIAPGKGNLKDDIHITSGDSTKTLDASGSNPAMHQGGSAIVQFMAVRRLTPVECERLQGFPDNYTNIPKAADGPRYKALGNSMAVPVMHWIGKRIQEVDATRRADER